MIEVKKLCIVCRNLSWFQVGYFHNSWNFNFSDVMKISVVIATRSNDHAILNLQRLFKSLKNQTSPLFEVLLICDRVFQQDEFLSFQNAFSEFLESDFPLKLITNLNSSFSPQSPWWVCSARNFWISLAKGDFIQLFDDDNEVDPCFLSEELSYYALLHQQYQTEIILCPTLKYKDTSLIQNQGFSSFLYWQARPQIHRDQEALYEEIQMFSGNGIFGKREVLQSVSYDENIARISEDIDYTLSLHEKGVKLFCIKDLENRHYEREKTLLEQARIWNYEQVKQKSRNRFLFVKKHGNLFQKILFFVIWLPWILLWLSIKILRYAGDQKKNLFKGLKDWIHIGVKHWFSS